MNRPLFRKRVFPWKLIVAILLVAVSLGVLAYFHRLSVQIRERFESRKWSVPSRVFSATVPIYPGLKISLSRVRSLLEVRRYREVAREPLGAGEFRVSQGSLNVHLREFRFPGSSLPPRQVRLEFDRDTLSRIRGQTGDLGFLELEPLEIARLFGPERESRLLINVKQLQPDLVRAVLAIEDHRFYEHPGMDFWSILRALWVDLRAGRVVEGGSTITQQLVKNYFLEPERRLRRKLMEASMALVLEALYAKDEILEMYLNEIYLGQNGSVAIHGIGEAARVFFGRNVEDLSLAESATLAGMIQAPNHYSPLEHPAAARDRRNTVLRRMLDLEVIGSDAYESARNEPVRTTETSLPASSAPYYVDYVRQQLQELYAPEVLASEGLTIYTSLHPEMSLAAETAVQEGLRELERERPALEAEKERGPLQAALIAVHPKTGAVLAMVGGRVYAESSFNRAIHASRQPGSAIKPFVFLSALDRLAPVSWLEDAPAGFPTGGADWWPRNHDDRYRGRVMMRQALEESLNVPTVQLAVQMGLENIVTLLRDLGIRSPLEPQPSLALGAFEVTPLELASAYATLDNEGQKPFLLSLREVVGERGEVQRRSSVDLVSVTSPARAFIITDFLQGAMERGTAKSVKRLAGDFPCAGKTGTTTDYRDSWFAGYTTDLLVLVWVGFDDNRPTHLTGATGAGRLWARFISEVRPWMNPQPFRMVPGVVQRIICTETGQLATVGCRDKRLEVFLSERVPGDYCTLHGRQ
ncbi:MAG: PBP1A family penicillin-binding protein [Syntrophobacteraceae bacterium]|jgi:penicillin-binding protein 1B|nr:PBP1A family penicillin-binding protein [Syntrophobacteraceae bacterium]